LKPFRATYALLFTKGNMNFGAVNKKNVGLGGKEQNLTEKPRPFAL